MNDEHTDVLIINKTCETQMSDDEQAGIDPERKSSEQQKKERDERALRRSQGIPASSPVAAQVVKKLTDSEKILITRDIEGIIINCARRGLKKDSIKSYHINKYRKENNVPRNFFFPSERFDELYKAFYKGDDDDEGDDDEGDDDEGDDNEGDDDNGCRNALEVSALSIIRSREIEVLGAEMTALSIKEERNLLYEIPGRPDEMIYRPDEMIYRPDEFLIYRPDLEYWRARRVDIAYTGTEGAEVENEMIYRPDEMIYRPDEMIYRPDEMINRPDEMNPTAHSRSLSNRTQASSLLQATLRRNRASFDPRLMRLRLATYVV